MQLIVFKQSEKTKRNLTKIFSLFFVLLIFALVIIIPIQEAKSVPEKKTQTTVEQVEKKKETPKEVIARVKKYSVRGRTLKLDLNTKEIAYIIDNNNEVLTTEKTKEILNTFDQYRKVKLSVLSNTGYKIEDLVGNAKGTYSCCSEDDNLVCTLTIYKEFIRCEVIKEEGKVITSDYILID